MGQLNIQQTDEIRQRLRSRYHELMEEVRDELERSGERHFIELAGRVRDTGEEAVGDLLADVGTAIVDRHVRELRDIEAAQRRMIEGDYGTCPDCGTDIDFERLRVFPTALRCMECQTRREKTCAHEPVATL